MAKVLLYNVNENYDLKEFEKIAAEKDFGIVRVEKEDIDQKVGYLLGHEGYERSEDIQDFDPNLDFMFILFESFHRDDLFEVLDTMREKGLSIQHKASETENNIQWTLRELLIENDNEGKMMGLINRINILFERANNHFKTHGEDKELKTLMDEIQAYFNNYEMFELPMAQRYYMRLLDEVIRVEDEQKS